MKDDILLALPFDYLEANTAVCDAVHKPGGETGLIRLDRRDPVE